LKQIPRRPNPLVAPFACWILCLALVGCGDDGPGSNDSPVRPGATYHLEIESDQWVAPEGIGNIIGTYVPDFLLGVRSSGDATVLLLGALVDDSAGVAQDLCKETIDFPVAPLDADGAFTAGPAEFPITVTGYDVTIHDLYVSGTFTPDGTGFVAGRFEGMLDAREFEGFFGTDATGVCELVASVGAGCEACPADDTPYCLQVRAEDLRADRVAGLELVEVTTIAPWCDSDVPECALGGGLMVYRAGLFNGYTLFAPLHDTTTYLIDICGEVAHTWASDYTPGHGVYLLENGHLMRAGLVGNTHFNPTSTGGVIEELDWDGNVIWTFTYSDDQRCTHHDIEPLPGGNVLVVAWEKKSAAEAVAAGRDPSLLAVGELWPDHIIEVEPVYPEGGSIVWEWHAWDHLIQDFDPAQANYGVVADHPELLDIHGARNASGEPAVLADLHHINAIDYHPDLDQILISLHSTHEIAVIDHSTTTAEAAGHSGGRYGRGGDLLYRWGNPATYHAAPFDERVLFGQHHAHWIEPGLPGAGHILIFNNGVDRLFSSVDEVAPTMDASGFYPLTPGAAWGPSEVFWQWVAPTPEDFFAPAVSGAQRLPNGNTLITDGFQSQFFEVDIDGVEVWRFHRFQDQVFRGTRYAVDYPGVAALAP